MTDYVLTFTKDVFHGVTIKSSISFEKDFNNVNPTPEEATKWLEASLEFFKGQSFNGVWFDVDLKHGYWITILADHGFTFHHARDDKCTMTKWLPEDKPNTLPLYPFTTLGVGGVVINKKGEILLMKEKRGSYLGWKFPGGMADPNESIPAAVEREVFEETGVKAKFSNVLTFRHISSGGFYPKSGDIYFLCVMRPEDEEKIDIVPCERETAAALWMTRDAISSLPVEEIHNFHLLILERLDKFLAAERKGCYVEKFSAKIGSYKREWDMFLID
ncbi:unnamed protein product [Bursaphelenchus xylophilus]|uniref:(pine wood nematode) hypothetical protein n=1 Tax=Bursaphelenchus xylophilus TaxID=6326 RepID=A0A1I7RRH1_BURXY|nr:unnamed protein product [Bursaphelenchus xylophilus]CAG9131034.1 unnamed protein product [Bursaphelenchus xylophilus]